MVLPDLGSQSITLDGGMLAITPPMQYKCLWLICKYCCWPPRYNWNIVESGVKQHTLTHHSKWLVSITGLCPFIHSKHYQYFERYLKDKGLDITENGHSTLSSRHSYNRIYT